MATDMIARAMAGNTKRELDIYKNNPDVADIVQTKDDLDNYDTSKLNENDIIKVLVDETYDNAQSYYKWLGTTFQYIGSLGPYYTEAEIDAKFPRQTTSITYNDLVTLKTSGTLVPGTYYKITDYVTTTIAPGTRSAGHQFDIIVLALTINTLSEDAYADKHSGDTYFVNNDLTTWRLKYCLDNDTTRFDWADTTNGKGVIFRLVDENLNDLPYDFKNIQFARYKITAMSNTNYNDFVGKYFGFSDALGTTIDSTDFKYYYTFNSFQNGDIVDNYDLSIQNILAPSNVNERFVKQVTIKEYLNDSPNYRGIKSLNNFVIADGNAIIDLTFGYGSHTNTIVVANDSMYSYFGSMFRNNLMWCSDLNHNKARECFEKNLVLSGVFNWNNLGNHFSKNYCKTFKNNNFGSSATDNKFAQTTNLNNIWYMQHCDVECLSSFEYNSGVAWGYVICENVTSISRLVITNAAFLTIKNRGIQFSNANFLQYVTIESETPNSVLLRNVNFNTIIASKVEPVRIVYDNSYLTIPNTQVKDLNRIQYTLNDQTITVYTITWQEYDGTEFKTKKYYSTDLGLTWTEDSGYLVSASEKSQITTNANAITAIKNGTTLNSFGDVETALVGITPAHLYRMHLKIGTDYAVIGITPTIDAFEVGQTYTVYDGTYRLTSDQRTAMKKVLSGISGNETEVPLQLYGALVNKTTRTCIELTDFSGVTEVKLDFNSTSNNIYTAGGTWTLKFTQLT